jgi:hypothetical protein
MRLRQVLAVLIVVVGLASSAEALTVRDIIELSKAGLSDDVLLALIEVDQTVFSIDPATLKMLKASGVSENVIIAMIRSGRVPRTEPLPPEPERVLTDPAPAPTPPEPQVIVIDHHDQVQVPVAVPVAVPVFVNSPHRQILVNDSRLGNDLSPRGDLIARPVPNNLGVRTIPMQNDRPQCAAPVYWGFGGKLRPDSWQPPQVCK